MKIIPHEKVSQLQSIYVHSSSGMGYCIFEGHMPLTLTARLTVILLNLFICEFLPFGSDSEAKYQTFVIFKHIYGLQFKTS